MTSTQPDIVLVLADDMGFSDIGCFGGEIETPHLDRLGRSGVRFTHFYNSPRCSPSRASLLTGLHPHQVGVGILNFDDGPDGYPGNLTESCATVAECLATAGYRSYLSGKWHLASDMDHPNPAWPTRRGFDRFYGTLEGAGSFYNPRTLVRDEEDIADEAAAPGFYYTDAISDAARDFVTEHHESTPPALLPLPCLHRTALAAPRARGGGRQAPGALRRGLGRPAPRAPRAPRHRGPPRRQVAPHPA